VGGAAVSENAERAAEAIVKYLEYCRVYTVQDQIAAIRRSYALTWQINLIQAGADPGLTLTDIATGIDLLLSRLVDQAQVIYDGK